MRTDRTGMPIIPIAQIGRRLEQATNLVRAVNVRQCRWLVSGTQRRRREKCIRPTFCQEKTNASQQKVSTAPRIVAASRCGTQPRPRERFIDEPGCRKCYLSKPIKGL